MRMLLMALTGIVFLIMGVAVGLLLQKIQLTSGHGGTQTTTRDSSHSEEEHASLEEPLLDAAPTETAEHGLSEHAEPVAAEAVANSENSHHSKSKLSKSEPVHPPTPHAPAESLPERISSAPASEEPLQRSHVPADSMALPPTGSPAEHLVQADKLLMVGNYQASHETCSWLVSQWPKFQPAEVRLRLALCEEALGELQQAQADYRAVVELQPALELRDAALLGQARLWCLAGRHEMATTTLFHAILSGSSHTSGVPQAQIPHELAILLAQRVTLPSGDSRKSDPDYQDETLISPVLSVKPYQVIAELSDVPLTPPEKKYISANDISIVERFNQSPEETFVNVRAERMTALELMRRVANRTGLTVRITEEARLHLQERTVQPDCVKVPLAIVFDSILDPFETIWRVEGNSLLVLLSRHARAEEINRYRIQSAQRALRYACRSAPNHPWAAASSLELARLAACAGTLDVASQYIQQMLAEFPRSEFQSVGWLNLGKLELRQGRLDLALKAFHRAADLLTGHPLEALSYLYAGRVQMENDRAREAISALTRALVLANGSKHEAMATLQLSSAYLMLEHYQRANEILIEHKDSLLNSPLRDQAAFLSSLIQYRAIKEKHEKFHAGTSLLGSMTNFDPGKCFGGHWQLLAGISYREFGMTQQEIAVISAMLENSYAYPLQNRGRLLMLEDAPQQLKKLQIAFSQRPDYIKPSELHFKTRLKEATTSFHDGHPEAALELSRELAEHPHISEEDRREALRLMGRIYQFQGRHEFAVQCFSGIIPQEKAPTPPPTAALPIPMRGVQ